MFMLHGHILPTLMNFMSSFFNICEPFFYFEALYKQGNVKNEINVNR
jgi:hypothetical protein